MAEGAVPPSASSYHALTCEAIAAASSHEVGLGKFRLLRLNGYWLQGPSAVFVALCASELYVVCGAHAWDRCIVMMCIIPPRPD